MSRDPVAEGLEPTMVVGDLLAELPLAAHVKSAMSSCAFSSRSGGVEGRPTDAYIASNVGESFASTTSASFLMAWIGWSVGTTVSDDISISIDPCLVFSPRMGLERKFHRGSVDPLTPRFSAAC